MTSEHIRLEETLTSNIPWKKWGPYLSERQWGTVREDYSANGDAWNFFTHDHARSRAYRWGEDGIAGISDDKQHLCFALALWNGKDPILKERLFGLTNSEGNHGEDVKEYYFYLDSTPTHSYMKYLYKYPQAAYPYADLVDTNRRRNRNDMEYELLDTGVFNDDRYFDVFVEYAKVGPEDIFVRITAINRGPDTAELHLLPTLWFRNDWSLWIAESNRAPGKPNIKQITASAGASTVAAAHPLLGEFILSCEGDVPLLFTEQALRGETDLNFLRTTFNKLLLNFTWWVNRKDRFGKNVFEGGFLGLDNIGVFDRSAPLPTGGYLEQADGTAWMALFSQNMLELAVELAAHDPTYEDMVVKFAEHFCYIAVAMNRPGQGGHVGRGGRLLLRPLAAPRRQRPQAQGALHGGAPASLRHDGVREVAAGAHSAGDGSAHGAPRSTGWTTLPAESNTGMSGGNSNWRGPIWMPVNALIIRALLTFYQYYGDNFKIECPTGSGTMMNLFEVSKEITNRLTRIFLRNEQGKRPVYGGTGKFQNDAQWRDNILFYEYFHGDNGAGLGASHQTGWTGLVARLIQVFGLLDPQKALEVGKRTAFTRKTSEP
jgi:hypothetical protein